jgi:hypothetical protein
MQKQNKISTKHSGVSPPKNPKIESAKSYFQEMEKNFSAFLIPLEKYEQTEFQIAKTFHNLSVGFRSLVLPQSVCLYFALFLVLYLYLYVMSVLFLCLFYLFVCCLFFTFISLFLFLTLTFVSCIYLCSFFLLYFVLYFVCLFLPHVLFVLYFILFLCYFISFQNIDPKQAKRRIEEQISVTFDKISQDWKTQVLFAQKKKKKNHKANTATKNTKTNNKVKQT